MSVGTTTSSPCSSASTGVPQLGTAWIRIDDAEHQPGAPYPTTTRSIPARSSSPSMPTRPAVTHGRDDRRRAVRDRARPPAAPRTRAARPIRRRAAAYSAAMPSSGDEQRDVRLVRTDGGLAARQRRAPSTYGGLAVIDVEGPVLARPGSSRSPSAQRHPAACRRAFSRATSSASAQMSVRDGPRARAPSSAAIEIATQPLPVQASTTRRA